MEIIWPNGLKHTRQREEVLYALSQSESPLSAAELKTQCQGTNLATIYRILETLEQYGLAEKVYLPDSDTAYFKRSATEHTHFATCLGCHRQIPLKGCPVDTLKLSEEASGFTVTGHRIELFGYCEECMRKRANR